MWGLVLEVVSYWVLCGMRGVLGLLGVGSGCSGCPVIAAVEFGVWGIGER